MKRILTADYLIIDRIFELKNPPRELREIIAHYNALPGSKTPIGKETFERLSALVPGMPELTEPGGSSANTLVTLSKLLGPRVAVDFIGAVGSDAYGNKIRESLRAANINLVMENMPGAEAAVSFVFVYPGGERVIFTYEGNARQLVTPAVIEEALVARADVLLMQGALWQKFGTPGVPPQESELANHLLALARKHGKALVLTLPTQSQFGADARTCEFFQQLVGQADVLACNDEELRRVFATGEDVRATFALLQQRLKKGAAGFVTAGAAGACVVTAGESWRIAPPKVAPEEVVNTLGAGDSACGAFVAAWLVNIPLQQCGEIAMAVAGCKIRNLEPRLADPRGALQRVAPELTKILK